MLIDRHGHVIDQRVKLELRPLLERAEMPVVNGIIVHQTDASTAASSLNAYRMRAIGAHFLIDKDGTIHQTASVKNRVSHVGALKARCVAVHRCAPGEEARIAKMRPIIRSRGEMAKHVPNRYPGNSDSIGIELVGKSFPGPTPKSERIYESVTPA